MCFEINRCFFVVAKKTVFLGGKSESQSHNSLELEENLHLISVFSEPKPEQSDTWKSK